MGFLRSLLNLIMKESVYTQYVKQIRASYINITKELTPINNKQIAAKHIAGLLSKIEYI